MIFSNYKNINKLEVAYDEEKKRINKAIEDLREVKYQQRKENERSYELFLYLKNKMNYSDEADQKMLRIIEEHDQQIQEIVRQKEMEFENEKYELKIAYMHQHEKLSEVE